MATQDGYHGSLGQYTLRRMESRWRVSDVAKVSVLVSRDSQAKLTSSADQTTRIHAYRPGSKRWAEIARPQIHGYDMTCGAWLGSYRFASGADEKLTRVFDAPEGFIQSLKALGMEHGEAGDVSMRS
jgi:elongator complex protein 2